MNNNETKSENITISAFTSKYQTNTQNTNNEIIQLNKNNKTQENLNVAKDKEEKKSSCCLINIYNYVDKNFLESRIVSPFVLTIFTLVGIVINGLIFVSSLIYSNIDFDIKTPFFYELITNWGSGAIMNIKVITGHNPNTDWYNFKKWGNTYLELSYDYNEYELVLRDSVIGGEGKLCGKDSIGNNLYFYKDCPINDIYVDESNTGKTDYKYENIDLKNGKYLHYTREKTDGTVYVQLLIKGEGDYCKNEVFENHNDVCYYMDNCYVNQSLYNITDCYQMDLYENLDQCNYADFASNNGLIGGEYYKDDDNVTLYARGWIGIDFKYQGTLNSFFYHYNEIKEFVAEYEVQLIMSIFSFAKTFFFILNNHFEWIKPWNLCLLLVNMFLTFMFFSFEVTSKGNVVNTVKAYYYLYMVYENLNKYTEKDYPTLEKKGFIIYYHNLLELGYIIKLISEICSWCDMFKYFDRCKCKCSLCDNRECVKCKKGDCIINNVTCSCDCEKCKNDNCFSCEGASGSREIKNIMLKKRCEVFQKFFQYGWLGFKIINVVFILFIILVIFLTYNKVENGF